MILLSNGLFYVLFFSEDAGRIRGWDQWNVASRNNIKNFVDSGFRNINSIGGTNPWPAFQHVFSSSLEPNPDTIFFLTDGGFNSDVVGYIKKVNSGFATTRINTIAFGNGAAINLLKQIARQNGGKYNLVP